MRTVLAALDSSAAARPVLETAIGIGIVTGATVEAVHVRESSGATPKALVSRRGITLREVDGPVEAGLLRELDADDVVVGVIGARGTPSGIRPVGRTALHVLEHVAKPIVVVPPDAIEVSARRPSRLLVPLEGTEESAGPVADILAPLLVTDVELVAVHVFTTTTAPPMVDHPDWGLDSWSGEFLARFCPTASSIDLRTGPVGGRIIEAASAADADAIVLSWSQDASAGRAAVVRTILEHSPVPVVLLPAGTRQIRTGEDARVSERRR